MRVVELDRGSTCSSAVVYPKAIRPKALGFAVVAAGLDLDKTRLYQ